MFIKPRDGLKIRDPKTQIPIPPEGTEVFPSLFWLRRLKSGDVVIVKNKTVSSKTTEKNLPNKKGADNP